MDYYPTLEVDDIYIPRPTNQIWGRLSSLNPNLQNIPLIKSIYTIGRGEGNDIMINDLRLSSVHCIITKDENDIVTLEDMSSNGTYVGNDRVGKRKSKILLPGEKIFLLHKSKVSKSEVLGYVFSFANNEANPLKRTRDYEHPQTAIEIKQVKRGSQDDIPKIQCCQCLNVTNQIVTARPCMHNFCGGCYSRWMDSAINCPKCIDEVQEMINRTIFQGRDPYEVMNSEEKRISKMSSVDLDETWRDCKDKRISQMSSVDLDETVDFQKHQKSKEDSVCVRNEVETDVSTNENSRNMVDSQDPKERAKAKRLARYSDLFNKFTAE